jgi:hypothetical protein
VAQVVEHLNNKYKALNSNPSTTKNIYIYCKEKDSTELENIFANYTVNKGHILEDTGILQLNSKRVIEVCKIFE